VLRDAPQNAVELRAQADALRGQCRGVTAMSPLTSATRTISVPGTVVQAPEPPRQQVVAQVPPVARDTTTPLVVPAPVSSPPAAPPAAPPARAAAQLPTAQTAAAQSAAAESGSPARPANARFSVQLAAYQRVDQAESLVRTLAGRNIEARVDGKAAPFRVRTGYYSTRTQAANRLAELKRGGHDGFVAELTP
jgi:cell division protein FtsN